MTKAFDSKIRGAGGKALMICSTGGHLTELLRIESRVGANEDSLWVTFDTEQSRQQLEGRRQVILDRDLQLVEVVVNRHPDHPHPQQHRENRDRPIQFV